jgi:hypothetical protein
MFDTRNELLNLTTIINPMGLTFLDPDGTIGQADILNHNRLYMGFELSEAPPVLGGFGGKVLVLYDEEEEEWLL